MNKVKLPSQSNGFSLIEMLVALGVSATVIIGLSTAVVNMQRSIHQQEDKLQVLDSKREVVSLVQDQTACTAQLAGQTLNENTPITLGSVAAGAKVSPRVQVENQFVENIVSTGPDAYKADVVTQYRNTLNPNIIYKPQSLVLYYTEDGGGLVNGCYGGELQALQASCSSSSGVWDPSKQSCDIVTPVCDALGGTMSGGKCEGVGETEAPTLATCDPKTTDRSDSSAVVNRDPRFTGSRSPQQITGRCSLPTSSSGTIVTGSCLAGTDSDYGGRCGGGGKCYRSHDGSCQYQCLDGAYVKLNNTCRIKYK